MPIFSLKKISDEAENRQTYLRGVSCYDAGKVLAVNRTKDDFYREFLTADVENANNDGHFHVEVGFDYKNKASYYSCTCPSFHRQGSACQHIVALMVHKYYADMLSGMTTAGQMIRDRDRLAVRSDEAARRMLQNYSNHGTVQMTVQDKKPDVPVSLFPFLSVSPRQVNLSFAIGSNRPYVLKNIGQFCEDMKAAHTVEYGRQLSFVHHPDCFSDASRPLLRFLMERYDSLCHARSASGEAVALNRFLPLTPEAIDDFFRLYSGQTVPCAWEEQQRDVRFCDENPRPVISVSRQEQRGGFLLTGDSYISIVGFRHLYLWKEDRLYRCTGTCSDALRDFLIALQATGGKLFISDSDMQDFCAEVLPVIEEYVILTGCTELLAPLRPQKPQISIYLDTPSPDTITARVDCNYNGTVFSLMTPITKNDHPRRCRLEEYHVRLTIQNYFQTYQPETGLLLLRGSDDTLYDFLTEGIAALHTLGNVFVSDGFKAISVTPSPKITVGVRMESHLLDLDVQLDGWDKTELARILDSYRQRKNYHRLKNGQFLSLEDTALSGLAQLADHLDVPDKELRTGHLTAAPFRALYLDQLLADNNGITTRCDSTFRTLVHQVRHAETGTFTPPESLASILRPYQRAGFVWLKTMEQYGFGGILADDMGLGKTIQMISLLLDAKEKGSTTPSLVICPTSLILNWESEIHRFAPQLTVLPLMGNAAQRAEQIASIPQYDVAVTSYDLLKRDITLYEPLTFAYEIIDEAQYIKNHLTQNARAVKAIHSHQRFAMTGTPIENRLSELWSIFDFLMPGFLYNYHRFRDRFEYPVMRDNDTTALNTLSRICAPFILRRLKHDVLKELPEKTESVLFTDMEEEQQSLYIANAANAKRELEAELKKSDATGNHHMMILAILTRLRQICCDPTLCYENYKGGSAKLESCMELLEEAIAGGHKVLVFSQFTSMLAILARRLQKESISYYLLQGSTPKEDRASMVDAFNTDDTPVFLISLKAGGTGLNLTGADMVIHFDPWWNLSAQNQATDRAHRIGQLHSVQVYKLIAKNTVEEKIMALQESKRELADAVIREGDSLFSNLSMEEVLHLLD